MLTSYNSVSFGRCLNNNGLVCITIAIPPLFIHVSLFYTGFRWFFSLKGPLFFSKVTPGQGLHEAIKTFDMEIGVDNLNLRLEVMQGIRQSVRFIMFALGAPPNIFLTEIL